MVFGSASSHVKHFARLLNVRCSLKFNKRSNENADKGFVMFFFKFEVELVSYPFIMTYIDPKWMIILKHNLGLIINILVISYKRLCQV